MPEIKLKARIQNKYETLDNWNRFKKGDFIPLIGEVCYGIDAGMLYQKIGDGETDFVDLPWLLNQADNEINDETSPAYIKNRLAYPEYIEVPQDEQVLHLNEIVSGGLGTKEEFLSLSENEQIKTYIDTSFGDTNNIFVGTTEIGGPTELIQNQFNKLFINIYTATNNKISCDFNSKNKLQSDTTVLGYSIFCFGNTHWANIITNIYLETIDSPILYYPQDNISTEKYCIVLIGPQEVEDDLEYYTTFVVFDNDIYPCLKEEDTDGDLLYKYPYDIQLLAKGQMHTIDDKYLGDIRSDFDELKNSSKSYIKNRPGVNTIADITDEYIAELGQYHSTITAGPYNSTLGQTLRGEKMHEDFMEPDLIHMLETCTVTIDGQTWYNCPVFQRTIFGSSDTRNDYYIGNPIYISNFTNKWLGLLVNSNVMIKGYKIYDEINNNLPFVIPYCPGSSTPLCDGGYYKFPKTYQNKETFSVKIIPEKLRMTTNVIRRDILPKETIIGVLNNELNSILLNGAYEASGANSLAAGQSTKAMGSESTALNYGTTASGPHSISAGEYTEASGRNSIAGGYETKAKGKNSIAFGSETIANGDNSIALGEGIKSSAISITPIDSSTFTFKYENDKINYTQYRLQYTSSDGSDTYTNWRDLEDNDYSIENGICTFTGISYGSYYGADYTAFKYIYLRKPTTTEHTTSSNDSSDANSVSLGKGNKAYASTYVLGYGNESKGAYQTVIGKNNEIIEGALVIGNGASLDNRSNAAVLDWNGNLKLSGQIKFNEDTSDYDITNNVIKLKDNDSETINIQLQYQPYYGNSEPSYDTQKVEIHNKNWWPVTGWNNVSYDEDNNEIFEDTNKSKVVFNQDGSLYVNYITGDTFEIRQTIKCPKGNYILSNGINENSSLDLYINTALETTNTGSYPGTTPIYKNTRGEITITIYLRKSSTESFETTFYPQLELLEDNQIYNTSYVAPVKLVEYFDNQGSLSLNTLQYRNLDNPILLCDLSSYYSVANYQFSNKAERLGNYKDIVNIAKQENRYIFDLKHLNNSSLIQANTIWRNENHDIGSNMSDTECGLVIKLTLGFKSPENQIWNSYNSAISPAQLSIVDLFDNAIMNAVGDEGLGGYKLPGGQLIDTQNNWSVGTEELKDLMTNSLQFQIGNGDITLRKSIDDNTGIEYCYLLYYIRCYEAGELRETYEMLAAADKLICYLPEGYKNIFVN